MNKEEKKKKFEALAEYQKNVSDELSGIGFLKGYDAGYKDAQNEWVDVNNRMPEEGVNVMAYTVSEFYEVMHYEDGYWIDLDFTMIKPIYVTHWMPLPKPPKKD